MKKSFIFFMLILVSDTVMSQSVPEYFGAAGEGFSSVVPGKATQLSYRMFSTPMAEDLCKDSDPGTTLVSPDPVITLSPGDTYSLVSLKVDAHGSHGDHMGAVPITVGIPEIKGGFLAYHPYELTLQALHSGTIQIEIRGYCLPDVRTTLTLKVEE